jgi:3-deoxy-D-arabino-heptulosonate 7-phosphate (DAHP) synthase
MIEVHKRPVHALSDGPQSLKPEAFDFSRASFYPCIATFKAQED